MEPLSEFSKDYVRNTNRKKLGHQKNILVINCVLMEWLHRVGWKGFKLGLFEKDRPPVYTFVNPTRAWDYILINLDANYVLLDRTPKKVIHLIISGYKFAQLTRNKVDMVLIGKNMTVDDLGIESKTARLCGCQN